MVEWKKNKMIEKKLDDRGKADFYEKTQNSIIKFSNNKYGYAKLD